MRDVRDFIYGSIEGVLIRAGRFRESGQFANELKRRCANLVVCRRRTEVMKCFDSSAHKEPLTADAVVSKVESITRMKTDFLFQAPRLSSVILSCDTNVLGLGEEM